MSLKIVPQSVVRGSVALFEQLFVDQSGDPIIPGDPTRYPEVTISDRDGVDVQTGIAIAIGDGRWRFQWFVPADAELSTALDQWAIEWRIITSTGREVVKSSNFAVIDTIEANPTERAYTSLVYEGTSDRLIIKFRNKPNEISLRFDDGRIVTDLTPSINEVRQDGYFVYYADTPPLDRGCYMSIWQSRENLLAPQVTFVQQTRVPDRSFWALQPDLRMFMDKVQKKVGHVQAYSDSDMYGYLLRGVDVINGYNPPTNWGLQTMLNYAGLSSYLLLAAAWWGLQAQYLSEGELAFNFSGQTITLDVDRTSYYDSALSRIKEYLDNLTKVKAALIRKVSVGSVNVRPYSYRFNNRVWKVQSSRGVSNFLPLLTDLGLI